jgi:hypothetical protein
VGSKERIVQVVGFQLLQHRCVDEARHVFLTHPVTSAVEGSWLQTVRANVRLRSLQIRTSTRIVFLELDVDALAKHAGLQNRCKICG